MWFSSLKSLVSSILSEPQMFETSPALSGLLLACLAHGIGPLGSQGL
jgi:hypothetical protein